MFSWVNFSVLVLSSMIFLCFYVRSVSPAGRAMLVGSRVYRLCYYDRLISGLFELIITVNYVLYRFHPLPVPMPENFPWPWRP